jgi:hypothetical protein
MNDVDEGNNNNNNNDALSCCSSWLLFVYGMNQCNVQTLMQWHANNYVSMAFGSAIEFAIAIAQRHSGLE